MAVLKSGKIWGSTQSIRPSSPCIHTVTQKKQLSTRQKNESRIWRARKCGEARDKAADSVGCRKNSQSETVCRNHVARVILGRFGCSWKLVLLVRSSRRRKYSILIPPGMSFLVQQHPLQRLQSPSRGLSALIHVCLICPMVLGHLPDAWDPWLTCTVDGSCKLSMVL